MRTSTRFSRGWNPIGRLVGSAGLVVLWMVVVGMMRPADTWADTVVMLDGSKVEGTIMAEDEKSITIEAAFAGGAIVQKKVIDKSTVKEVVRLTEAQRAAQSRERDFAAVNRYQLNPASSFSVEEYDRVIGSVLEPFLAKYPDAPQAGRVKAMVAEWKSERDQVASGKVKVKGEWMDRSEAMRLHGDAQVRTMLQQADAAIARRDFPSALKSLQTALPISQGTDLEPQVRRKQVETYVAWVPVLESQKTQLETRIQSTEQDIQKYRQQKTQAEAAMGMKSGSLASSQPAPSGSPYKQLEQRVQGRLNNASATRQEPSAAPAPSSSGLQKMGGEGGAQLAQAVQQLTVLEPSLAKLKADHQQVATTLERAKQMAATPAAIAGTTAASAISGSLPASTPGDKPAGVSATTPSDASTADNGKIVAGKGKPVTGAALMSGGMDERLEFVKRNWLLVVSAGLVLMGLIAMAIPRRS